MFIYNRNGLWMLAAGFAVTFGIGYLVGISSEGSLMVILGPTIAVIDLIYRFTSEKGHWLYPENGGSLFFVPAWCVGVTWFILGIIYMTRGS